MSGHIKYERRIPIYGRAGDGDMVELGVLVLDDDAKPSEIQRQTAAFYRSIADYLDETAEELEEVSRGRGL